MDSGLFNAGGPAGSRDGGLVESPRAGTGRSGSGGSETETVLAGCDWRQVWDATGSAGPHVIGRERCGRAG